MDLGARFLGGGVGPSEAGGRQAENRPDVELSDSRIEAAENCERGVAFAMISTWRWVRPSLRYVMATQSITEIA